MNIKKLLQAPLRRRQTRRYEARIEEQTVRYHDWIVRKEKKEQSGLSLKGQELKLRCISFGECGASFPAARRMEDAHSMRPEDSAQAGEEILVFYRGDVRPEDGALARIADYFARHPETILAYADEDERLEENGGRRTNPWLKPDWSPDTLMSYFYFGNLFAVRAKAAEAVEWLQEADYRKNLYDFCLKLTDKASPGPEENEAAQAGKRAVGHIDSVLLHNGMPIEPFGMEEEYDGIKRQAYIRRGWPEKPSGMVSIIIPSKDNPRVLSTCIHSILEGSSYLDFEIIVVDNGSSDKNRKRIERMLSLMTEGCRFRYVYEPMEFNFSRMCNRGAALAKGDYILLLNDDIEVPQDDWLERMVEKAALPHVGAVGVKLLYPESHTIQHAGITNIRLGPAHKLQFRDDRNDYYFLRNRLAFDVLGVTGACLMVRRSVYEKSGGLKEELRVAFNDVEFCYRLHEMGYQNVVRNDVALYHHESLSRGLDDSVEKLKRLHQELNLLYTLHPTYYAADPYYHRYLVRDVLDQEFYAGNRYEYEDRVDTVVPQAMRDGLRPEWKNEVLRMGIEFAGDMQKWETGRPGGGDYFIQGWCYALQVDNSQYRFNLLLKQVERDDGPMREEAAVGPAGENASGLSAVWRLPVNRQYRPDIQENLGHMQMVALTGVCLRFDRNALPEGEYLIGFLWEDCCSRQKLYQWTAETMRIES